MMRCARLVLLVLPLLPFGAAAQSLVTLSGAVYDAATNDPLATVNVFLANTTLGDQTDASGVFMIRNVPLGTHELIVSILGYEVQKHSVRVTNANVSDLVFKLISKPLLGPEIEVVAEEPDIWRKNLRRFEELFWGKSQFAAQCKILNAEVLDFTRDAGGWFSAQAGRPLLLENRALGYRLEIILTSFDYHERRNEIRYSMIPRFEAMTANNADEERRWHKNRFKAYLGSQRHFLGALAARRTREEGFEIYTLPKLPWEDRVVKHVLVKPERILMPGELPSERQLSFEDFLEINFNGEREKTSWMATTSKSVLMNVAGYVYNGLEVFVYGHWFHQRLAEALPRDYVPPKE